MASLHIYLNFPGNTEEAFNFYRSVFGGEFLNLQRYKDSPYGDNVPAADKERILHIALPVGKSSVLMAADALESMGQKSADGGGYSISIDTESEEEANALFNGLAAGGKITMPLEKAFWGAYFGMLVDKFGIRWMVNFDEKK